RLLAIHHPDTGLVAQFLHQARGNCGHVYTLWLPGGFTLRPWLDNRLMLPLSRAVAPIRLL
ncbi:MAG: hypothetical protein KAQ88_07960, partial [Hyphomicrobiaceae bacterium]|nr:hypothetical protein [Hyphomicrobiaceae bacterium]